MKTIELEKNIIVYQFDSEENRVLGTNILVVINGDECLVVDTGYPRHFKIAYEDILRRNLKITHVVLSHFHPDHIGGFPEIKDLVIYGSVHGKETIKVFGDAYKDCLPNVEIKNNTSFKFGNHLVDVVINKGHSVDGLIITLDNKYIFVGDDFMSDNDGLAVIPFCAEQNLEQHVSSIKSIIKVHKNKVIIPAHGMILKDDSIALIELNKRLKYLEYFIEKPNKSYEEFYEATSIELLNSKWHNYNMGKN